MLRTLTDMKPTFLTRAPAPRQRSGPPCLQTCRGRSAQAWRSFHAALKRPLSGTARHSWRVAVAGVLTRTAAPPGRIDL